MHTEHVRLSITFRVDLAAGFAAWVPGSNAAGGRTRSADSKLTGGTGWELLSGAAGLSGQSADDSST